MKNGGILAIVNSGLLKPAIKQLIQEANISEPVDFDNNLQKCINGTCKPQFLLIDSVCIPMPVQFSLERINAKNPSCKILVLNAEKLEESAHPYISAFINSQDSDDQIQSIFKEFFQYPGHTQTTYSKDNSLSEREIEVVQLVALGKTNKEISDSLHISTHTVITHRKNITTKLGIKTIAGLAVYSVLNGLIDPEDVNK